VRRGFCLAIAASVGLCGCLQKVLPRPDGGEGEGGGAGQGGGGTGGGGTGGGAPACVPTPIRSAQVDGGVCGGSGLCWERPRPTGNTLRPIFSNGNDLWGVGDEGTDLYNRFGSGWNATDTGTA